MGFKRAELYRGFNIFTEEIRDGAWALAVVEIPSFDSGAPSRTPGQGRVAGTHPSKDAAVLAGRGHIDRIHKNRLNRASQTTDV